MLDADALLRQVYEAARTISYAGRRHLARGRPGAARPLRQAHAARTAARPDRGQGRARHRSPRASSNSTVRRCSPGPHAPSGTRCCCCAPRPPPPRPACRWPPTRSAGCATATAGRPLPVPWPAEAREQLVTLLGAGTHTVPVWEALEAEGIDHAAAARLGARPLPPAAQPRPHLDRRPPPRRDRRTGLRPDPPGAPPRPAADRRPAARHRQGLARRPLGGRRDHRPRRGGPDRLRRPRHRR